MAKTRLCVVAVLWLHSYFASGTELIDIELRNWKKMFSELILN